MLTIVLICLYAFGALSLLTMCLVYEERFGVTSVLFCALWPLAMVVAGMAACVGAVLSRPDDA